MAARQPITNLERSEDFGLLQTLVDKLFPTPAVETVRRMDVLVLAESSDLPEDLLEIVNLLPSGDYSRRALCDQLNSSLAGHAWGQVYGTVE